MAELTAEGVRLIVREEIAQTRRELEITTANLQGELHGAIFELRGDVIEGFDQVLDAVQVLDDAGEGRRPGSDGRLRGYNERIARLERWRNRC